MTTATAKTRPRVLFIGRDTSSTHIAASLLSHLVGDRVDIDTAGTRPGDPGGQADELLVAMGLNPMSEHRVSVSSLNAADRVISLGVGLDVARVGGAHYEEWDLAHEDLIERVETLSQDLLRPSVQEPNPGILARVRTWFGSPRS